MAKAWSQRRVTSQIRHQEFVNDRCGKTEVSARRRQDHREDDPRFH